MGIFFINTTSDFTNGSPVTIVCSDIAPGWANPASRKAEVIGCRSLGSTVEKSPSD
jgi:hypothetical protein